MAWGSQGLVEYSPQGEAMDSQLLLWKIVSAFFSRKIPLLRKNRFLVKSKGSPSMSESWFLSCFLRTHQYKWSRFSGIPKGSLEKSKKVFYTFIKSPRSSSIFQYNSLWVLCENISVSSHESEARVISHIDLLVVLRNEFIRLIWIYHEEGICSCSRVG